MKLLMDIKVRRVETRAEDTWYDMSLRQLRNGEVNYYKVNDFQTGDWLFKLCKDSELGKIIVKAVKCPAGVRFSQLEGNTMVFQNSKIEGMLYDVLSLSEADKNDTLKRNNISSIKEVPNIIRQNYTVKTYEEATGKKALGKHFVTLSNPEDEKSIVKLFLLERAWTLAKSTPEEKLREKQQQKGRRKTTRKEVDTGQVWTCPICGKKHRLTHIETEKTVRHGLRKPHL